MTDGELAGLGIARSVAKQNADVVLDLRRVPALRFEPAFELVMAGLVLCTVVPPAIVSS